MKKSTLEDLRKVLSGATQENTGLALILPSGVTRELALQAVNSLNLSTILRDIGIVTAREISDELERLSLRPADYALMPEIPQMVAEKLANEIKKSPTEFVSALIEQLKLRG